MYTKLNIRISEHNENGKWLPCIYTFTFYSLSTLQQKCGKLNFPGIQTFLLFISSMYMYMHETKLREMQSLSISFMVKSY